MTVRRHSLLVLFMIGFLILTLAGAAPGDSGADQTSGSASAPLPPAEAARRMTVPEGFNVTLFAAEPDVVQPIAFTIDPRGRLWVVENYSYPVWLGGPRGRDRILIFEDADGDGRFDRRTGLLRQGDQLHRHRAGLRRRLGLCHAQPSLHSRSRRRRPARRPADGRCWTAGTSRPSIICSMP